MITSNDIKKAIKPFYTDEALPDYADENNLRVRKLNAQKNGEKYVYSYQAWGYSESRLRVFINKLINNVDTDHYGNVRNGCIALSPANWELVISKLGELE